MAMVLDAFASYVQNMLTEMVKEEVYMLLGDEDEIEKMDVKLEDLKNFLADADRRNITDKSVQEWVAQLKRAMYEATDILDLCELKAMERGPSTKGVGWFNPLLFCMRNPSHAHDIGTRIKALNKRLDTIKERSAAFSLINLGSYEDRSSKVHGSHSGDTRRETSGEYDRSGVVGEKIEQDTKKLVEIMLSEKEGNANIMVVAIVGVGGIGKTTLAQKIWLSISKDLDKVELLRTTIMHAGGVHGGEKALAVLQPILAATLKGKKLFLVLDDVWNHGAWDDVLKAPLANVVARGSRVLVTTRDERVARGMKAVLPYHHVDKLEEEDVWSLLKKQEEGGSGISDGMVSRERAIKSASSILETIILDEGAEPTNLPLALLQHITENFVDEREIGRGGFGVVYKGDLRSGSVAVKRLLNGHTIQEEPFNREATSLISVKHKNIVRFLGYCANTENKAMLHSEPGETSKYVFAEIRERLLCFEYINNGSLEKYLTDELSGLAWPTRYQIIRGICDGLVYLHKKYIIHMDMKPANILLDDLMIPKITDFGISKLLEGATHAFTANPKWSLGYCAPEFITSGKVSTKSDIYSLGVIITELVTGCRGNFDIEHISPYPWELLEFDMLELNFPIEINRQIPCSFQLTNVTDDYVAFDMKPAGRLQYSIEPEKGVVPPRSKHSVMVTLQAQERVPHALVCKDELLIMRCAAVNEGLMAADINGDMFNKMSGKVVDEVTLKVIIEPVATA